MFKTLLRPVAAYFQEVGSLLGQGWNRFWFTPADGMTLACVRIVVGLVLLYSHLATLPDLQDLVGRDAWVDAQAIEQFQDPNVFPELLAGWERARQSVWFYVQDPTFVLIIELVFIAAYFCLTIGFFSRTAAVLTWIGHLSYIHRGHGIWYGMDSMLAFLTLYLMIGATGATLSVDRLIARYRQTRGALRSRNRPAPDLTPTMNVSTNIAIRLIQIHLCIVYLCSGCAKLNGDSWWNGIAVWYTLVMTDFAPVNMLWLGHMPDWVIHTVSTVGVLMTIFFEVGFTFLVWNRMWKPIMLTLGVIMHVGIIIHMGLGTFQTAMLAALLAFIAPASLRWFFEVLLRGSGGNRYVFERESLSQTRLASLAHAGDPWHQVALQDASEKGAAGRAGTLVTAGGKHLHDAEAFTRLTRILKPLWPIALLTFIPGFSKLFFRTPAARKEKLTPVAAGKE